MLNKIDKVLTHVENAITGSLFIASLLVLGWNIIMRKVFHNASTWAEEAIRYAIIWVTFVGSSQCAKSGNHVGIDILVEALPKGCRKYVYAFSSLLACGFCVFCAWYGWSLTDMVITNNRVSAAMEMPMWDSVYLDPHWLRPDGHPLPDRRDPEAPAGRKAGDRQDG